MSLDVPHALRSGLYWIQVNWRLALVIFSVLGFIIVNAPFDGPAEPVYKVIMDAGSTGTRAHVFKFNSPKFSFRSSEITEADLDLISIPLSVKIKGGLSDFSADPKLARPGLENLVSQAKAVVPRHLWPSTEVILMATAGLRLINPKQAEALLAEARSVLKKSGFKVGTVDVIDGKLEAKLMYTMTHFVLGSTGRMAIVDLGGGSVQLAYKATSDLADLNPSVAAEIASYLEKSKRSTLYLHSWLGFGLVAFRLKALEMVAAGQPHPCVPEWTPEGTEYKYGDKRASVVPRAVKSGVSPVDACLDLVRSALSSSDSSGQCRAITLAMRDASTAQCGLNGSWLGPSDPNSISEWRLFSYIFDLAAEEGMIKMGASDALLTATDFKRAAKAHCEASTNKHADKIEWWKCVDLVYVSALLTDGFKLEADFPLRVTKHLSYKGEIELEAAWPLGAAIAAIQNDL